jgi:hypothetical protein
MVSGKKENTGTHLGGECGGGADHVVPPREVLQHVHEQAVGEILHRETRGVRGGALLLLKEVRAFEGLDLAQPLVDGAAAAEGGGGARGEEVAAAEEDKGGGDEGDEEGEAARGVNDPVAHGVDCVGC